MPQLPWSHMSSASSKNANFRLILASTSRYRAGLLSKFGLQFEQIAPDCDETAEPGESPDGLVRRLSEIKALSVLSTIKRSDAGSGADNNEALLIVIGSDQVADCNGVILGKPHTAERAIEQLQRMRGQSVVFRTGHAA